MSVNVKKTIDVKLLSIYRFLLIAFYFSFFMASALLCAPYHRIDIDGNLDEWPEGEKIANDIHDGEVMNRIDALYVTWDADNLYIGVNYKLDDCGMLLYLDTDYGLSSGFDDLTKIDTWNKGAKFSAGGFLPDFMYGSWDGDGGSFYQITSSLSASGVSANCKTDFSSYAPGTEISIGWDTLFPSGFPAGTKIAMFCSLADGTALALDCAPDNIAVVLPLVDTCTVINCDSNSDGVPDSLSSSNFEISYVRMAKIFSPNADGINDDLNITVALTQSADIYMKAFNIEGKKVWQSAGHSAEAGETTMTWNGRDFSGAMIRNGVYILNIRAVNSSGEEVYKNKPVAIVK
ncbi:MAG: hypothetical protein CVU78_00395 [Elusimicrobia bacterium HGW-Elusimicrobia-2]|nr:MAG: hypothetical protein CVU78_00395 [Elusimicrobia bacterium HGW-Elusimicrobia-2]